MRDFTQALQIKTNTLIKDKINNVDVDYTFSKNDKIIPETNTDLISLIIPIFQEEKIIETTLKTFTNELRKKIQY